MSPIKDPRCGPLRIGASVGQGDDMELSVGMKCQATPLDHLGLSHQPVTGSGLFGGMQDPGERKEPGRNLWVLITPSAQLRRPSGIRG